MNLVGISQKILTASAVLNTVVTTLAFFYLVINGGSDDLQRHESNCLEPCWRVRLFLRRRGSRLPHFFGVLIGASCHAEIVEA